jgi:hypothetical protein
MAKREEQFSLDIYAILSIHILLYLLIIYSEGVNYLVSINKFNC